MDVDTRGSFSPLAPGRRSDRVRSFGEGRLCSEPGCSTVLSIYNASARCAVHQRRGDLVPLRRMESPEAERGCTQCGARFRTANPRRRYCSARCRAHAFAEREKTAQRAAAGARERVVAGLQERAAA